MTPGGRRGARTEDRSGTRPDAPSATSAPALADAISAHPKGAVLTVTVVPRSGVTAIDRADGEAVWVRVAAPPVDGAANTALIRYLAELLDIPRNAVRVVSGQTARRKRLLVAGIAAEELARRLTRSKCGTIHGR